MKTAQLNWNNLSTEEAAKIFEEVFKGVCILPSMEVFQELKKATKFEGEVRSLELFENDEEWETTTYSFLSSGNANMHAELDAETGSMSLGVA